jgi:hypothetical protein
VKTFAVEAGLFFMACVQVGSLNGIEEALKRCPAPCRWHRGLRGSLPSADRLGEVAWTVGRLVAKGALSI